MSVRHFADTLDQHHLSLKRGSISTLQVNIGRRCNQACHHCHVESSPLRTENMDERTVRRLIEVIDQSSGIKTVDITGGAPEMNPHFRFFVTALRNRGIHVIDRCNLTILFEPDQKDTAEFLRDHQVEVIASLPCYSKDNVEKQRGRGVFDKSIEGLRLLNRLGYGQPTEELRLNLVYNPLGPSLPPPQAKLEAAYKTELRETFGIEFNSLYTITNMPIKRFLQGLQRSGELEKYMTVLVNAFNPAAVEHVMCRSLVSVGWNGSIYDCDFNQMLEIDLPVAKSDLWKLDSFDELKNSPIAVADHCYACTAGAGSSCGGALKKEEMACL